MDYQLILISMGVLGVISLAAAVLLYYVSQYFKVEEDPRIDLVTAALPGANCGGCGFAGCRAFRVLPPFRPFHRFALLRILFVLACHAHECNAIRRTAPRHQVP